MTRILDGTMWPGQYTLLPTMETDNATSYTIPKSATVLWREDPGKGGHGGATQWFRGYVHERVLRAQLRQKSSTARTDLSRDPSKFVYEVS